MALTEIEKSFLQQDMDEFLLVYYLNDSPKKRRTIRGITDFELGNGELFWRTATDYGILKLSDIMYLTIREQLK